MINMSEIKYYAVAVGDDGKHTDITDYVNETVINPPAELGRLTDARGGEQSIKIENSAV